MRRERGSREDGTRERIGWRDRSEKGRGEGSRQGEREE